MARLLLDANLSWRSADVLREHFEECLHADSIGIAPPAKDSDIWDYAAGNDLIIVTNDADFAQMLILRGFPPKVVLLRTGNLPRKRAEHILIAMKDEIALLRRSTEYGLLEVFS